MNTQVKKEPPIWVHWHWQDLNREYAKPGRGVNGRAWLHINRVTFGIEWVLFRWTGFNVSTWIGGDENDLTLCLSLLFFSVYLSVDNLLPYKALPRGWHRSTGVKVHDGTIWIDIWNDDSWGGRGKKWWQDINIHVVDILLGRQQYSERDLYTERVDVVMPEGNYPATCLMFESTWKRPRWFAKRLIRADIKPDKPIGFPCKGENSWDIGDDATYEMTCVAANPQEAAQKLSNSVMRNRNHNSL